MKTFEEYRFTIKHSDIHFEFPYMTKSEFMSGIKDAKNTFNIDDSCHIIAQYKNEYYMLAISSRISSIGPALHLHKIDSNNLSFTLFCPEAVQLIYKELKDKIYTKLFTDSNNVDNLEDCKFDAYRSDRIGTAKVLILKFK